MTRSILLQRAIVGVLALTAGCGQSSVAYGPSTAATVDQPSILVPSAQAPTRAASSTLQSPPGQATSLATVTRSNGRIAFMRWNLALDGQEVFTIDPDGSHERRLVPGLAEFPHWSPDGSEIAVLCCDAAARIVAVDSGATRTLPMPDPAHVDIACAVWSRDGARLFCEGTTSSGAALNGIYSIRSSDGGDVKRVTQSPGNDDAPADVSPDGSRLLVVRLEGDRPGLYVVGVDGSAMRRIDTGSLLDIVSGSWSPTGDRIVFAARKTSGDRRSVFVVGTNGGAPHEVTMTPACGGATGDARSRGCLDPRWSPDGTLIVLDILLGADNQKQIYTVDGDGSHLSRVTHHGSVSGGEGEQAPDWGIHPRG